MAAGEAAYFQFEGISRYEWLVHGVFTRHGGVSLPPYDTLNTSLATGDAPEAVRTNLRIIQDVLGTDRLMYMKQVHGKDILVLGHDGGYPMTGAPCADAMITDRSSLALMVKQADCQGVILLDPEKRVISVVHCGWRGNTCDILGAVVARMRTDFGCRESDLKAAIGPSLGPCCAEFKTYREIFPENFRRFMVREHYFDLWDLSRWQLIEAGIRRENIEVAGVCTRCRSDLFYSYRAEKMTGRFGTVVMLKEAAH